MRTQFVSSALAVALLAGCVPLEERTAHFENKWSDPAVTHLDLTEVSGTVTVIGDSPSAITMSATVRARGVSPDPKKPFDGYMTAEIDGDTLAIRSQGTHSHVFVFSMGKEVRIDYDLHVPPQLALNLVTVNGRIETKGISGETAAKTVNGTVNLEATGSNEVEAKSVNGRVEAKFLHDFHGARLGTVNGRVVAVLPPSASFYGDFTQVNGDFEAAFPLNIHSHPGSRRVSGEVNGGKYQLKISTVNGDITIDNGAPPTPPPVPNAPPPPPPVSVPRT
jgi:putative adhesin